MATFYIQLENKLLQISGELTAENISKALGYVPVSHNVTNELSQRVDNITFDSLKDNPFLQDGSGELNIVDEAGNIIAKIYADGIHSVDFIAGEHRLSDKTDKTYVDEAVKNVKVDLTGYATEEYVNNIDFYNIKDNPIVNNGDGKLLFVDENGYIGLQLEENGLYVKDVIADGHTLSQKADKSELSNYATEEDLSSIEFNSLQNNPIVEDSNGEFNLVDDLGNVGFKVNQEGLFVKDVIAGEHMLSNKADKTYIDDLGVTELNAILVDTDAEADDPIIPDYITENELETALSGKMDKVTLSKVATSGSYNDLSNKPTIPSAVTESTVSGWGFTKNTGTYSKPSTGIPKTDLASAVQTSLGKADTALQAHQDISGKQDKLVSGTNIKTINGTSILGSGNIVISGGGGSSSGGGAYSEVNHGTSDTTFTITPNTFHIWDEVANLTLTLGSETAGVANEYLFQFTSGSEATTLSLPSDLKWANDSAPTIAENKIYQISILKGLASVLEFNNAPSVVENKVTVSVSGTKYLVSLQYAAASDIVVKVRTGDGPISVSIPSGEISKIASPIGPMVDSGAYIESIVPAVDTNYTYTW